MPSISNIFWLGLKELRSFSHDLVLLGLVIYAFSVAVISQAQSNSQEVHNGSVAIVDEDHSELSRRVTAFLPPYFNAGYRRAGYRAPHEQRHIYVRDRHSPQLSARRVGSAEPAPAKSMSMPPAAPGVVPVTYSNSSQIKTMASCHAPKARRLRLSIWPCALRSTPTSRQPGSSAFHGHHQ